MSSEREFIQTRRRRGIMLKFVRQGYEEQFSHMDDLEMCAMMQNMGWNMGRDQVLTMLQDLRILGYLNFRQGMNEITGRMEISEIELTAAGLGLVLRRKSNDDVLVD